MAYKLTHFGLACKDLDKAVDQYRNALGFEVTARLENKNGYKVAYLGKGSDGLLEIIENPVVAAEREYLGKKGNVCSVSFEVSDADEAFEDMKAKGAKVAFEPVNALNTRVFGVLDPDDLLVKIYNYTDENKIATPDLSIPMKASDMTLHHICKLTKNLVASEKWYEDFVGLKTIATRTGDLAKTGGYNFMIDPYYDKSVHSLMFEIIGGPDPEKAVAERVIKGDDREQVVVDKYGYTYDHICVTAPDVPTAWKNAIEKGTKKDIDLYLKK